MDLGKRLVRPVQVETSSSSWPMVLGISGRLSSPLGSATDHPWLRSSPKKAQVANHDSGILSLL